MEEEAQDDGQIHMTKCQHDLHEFRKEIDANIKKAESMLGIGEDSHPSPVYGREMALVRTKLQEAKMWAGKCLEVLGSPFPAELRDEAK